MKSKLFLAVALLVGVLAMGCSSVKDANEKNFKNAAQHFMDTQYPYCYITVNFPYSTETMSLRNTAEILHVLSTLGIVKETEVSRNKFHDFMSGKEKEVIIYSYDLTDEGKKYYKADASKNLSGDDLGGFCFGKATVDSIVNFTAPTDAMGAKVSEVIYTYTVTDFPEWAKNPELLQLDDRLKKDATSAETPIKTKGLFVLTNNGWVHHKLFKE